MRWRIAKDDLQKQLDDAVKIENFEEAKILKDQIDQLLSDEGS